LQHSFFADAMRKGEGKPSPEKVEMIRDVVGVIYAGAYRPIHDRQTLSHVSLSFSQRGYHG